jgi:DNA primase
MLGVNGPAVRSVVKKQSSSKLLGLDIDPLRIVEIDVLCWALRSGEMQPRILELLQRNEVAQKMKHPLCRQLLEACIEAHTQNKPCDLLSLASLIDEAEASKLMQQVFEKKINLQKAEEGCLATLTTLLQRDWLEETEKIKIKIQSGSCSDEEALELARQFAIIKKHPPQVKGTLHERSSATV